MRVIGCLREETSENKRKILEFLEKQDMICEVVFFERKGGYVAFLGTLINGRNGNYLKENDTFVVFGLGDLGFSLESIMEFLGTLLALCREVIIIEEDIVLNELSSLTDIGLAFLKISRGWLRKKLEKKEQAQALRKAEGKSIGRPLGSFKSRLDPHRKEIESFLAKNVTQSYIAKKFGVTRATLSIWLKKTKQRDGGN